MGDPLCSARERCAGAADPLFQIHSAQRPLRMGSFFRGRRQHRATMKPAPRVSAYFETVRGRDLAGLQPVPGYAARHAG